MNEVVFTGMLAELIRLCAERKGVSPSEYVLSLFDAGCNAPKSAGDSIFEQGAMHRE